MKKTAVWAMAGCVVLGALRLADLIWFTDPAGGLAVGPVWVRWLAGVLAAAACWLLGRLAAEKTEFRPQSAVPWLLPAGAGALAAGVAGFLSTATGGQDGFTAHHMTLGRLLAVRLAGFAGAGLLLLLGVWCLLLAKAVPQGKAGDGFFVGLGTAGSAAFFLETVLRFVLRPASWYRLGPAVEVFAALGALLFSAALVRALAFPTRPGVNRSLAGTGLLAFLLCTCLALPQAVWQWAVGAQTGVGLVEALFYGFWGLLGAAAARGALQQTNQADAG